jgi:hypothetical protein
MDLICTHMSGPKVVFRKNKIDMESQSSKGSASLRKIKIRSLQPKLL